MKKAVYMLILALGCATLFAQNQGLNRQFDEQLSPQMMRLIEESKRQTRQFSFTFDPPNLAYNLPDITDIADPMTGTFFEDQAWTKDFSRHISNPDGTTLYLTLFSPPVHFQVSQPDPQNPFLLQFQPLPSNWYGSEVMILVLSDAAPGSPNRTEAFAAIRVNVTSVLDPPVWSGLPADNTFSTAEETPLLLDFQDYISCIDSAADNFDLYIAPAAYPIDVSQAPNALGHLVTFAPQPDYNGVASYELTAVDRFSNAYSTVTIQIEVTAVNDPPVIISHLPLELVQNINQGSSLTFSVEAQDAEDDPLSHTWTLSGLDNGVPYSTVVSTSASLEYQFNLPGTRQLAYEVYDGAATASLQWTINVSPNGPVFEPLGGTYTQSVSVTLAPPPGFAGAVIHYTLDGSEPTDASPIYSSPIDLATIPDLENVVTIKAFFIYPGFPPSQTGSQTYMLTGQVSAPVFEPLGGLYYAPTSVALSSNTPDAAIYFTSDGSTPLPGNPGTELYQQPVTVPGNSLWEISAIAVKAGWLDSPLASQTYEVTGSAAVVSYSLTPPPLPGGEYYTVESGDALNVVIGELVLDPSGATLYYTLDNSLPGPDNPAAQIYTPGQQIPLTNPTWITFRAWLEDWLPSDTYSFYYDVRTRARILPFANGTVFDPAPGFSTTPLFVSINTQTLPASASIYYTTDGSDPVEDPGLLYAAPIMVSQSATIKAMAVYPGIYPSQVYSGAFEITGTVDAPAFAPLPGSYASPFDLVISTVLPGTSIYYTLDGSEPTQAANLYTAPVYLGVGLHQLRARAYKNNWDPSPVSEGYYSVGVLPPPEFNLPEGIYQDPIVVELSVPSVPDASIYYTTDGSDPGTGSSLYDPGLGIPIGLQTALTIKAIAWKTGWQTSEIATRSYQVTGTVATPVFTPDGGVYPNATTVTISTATPDALIRYTLDGQDPSLDYGTSYAGPVTISSSATLKARAFRTDWRPSEIQGAVYTIFGNIADPIFTPGAGTYTAPLNVYVSVNPPDAAIYYTTDGSVPTQTNGMLYSPADPIYVSATMLLRAAAFKTGWNPSAVVAAQYVITGTVSAPVFNPPSGQYASSQQVAISTVPAGASIVFTLDGSQPTQTNGTVYAGPITVAGNTIIKAFAYLAGWEDSAVSTASYVINGPVGTPVMNPAAGYYNSAQTLSISVYPPTATIRYTLDGSVPTPSNGFTYSAPFSIDEHTIVRAYAYQDNWLDSAVATAEYFFVVSSPAFSLPSGIYPDAQTLTLSVPTPGASIRYTLDGSDPSPSQGLVYTAPISIGASTTVKAIAYRANWISSNVVSQTYVINGPVADPLFSVAAGDYLASFSVGISTLPANASIYYTTDGTDPSQANGTIYTQPIQVLQNTILRARAYLTNWLPSNISTVTYNLYASPVAFMPGGGTYNANQNVSLSTVTPGAVIHYTLDGSDPVPGSSPVYNPLTPILVDHDLTIKALATKANWFASQISSASYVIDIPLPTVATPQILPPGGVYNAEQTVTITTATPDATIRYTLDGSDPSLTNGISYTGSFVVTDDALVKARGFKTGYNPSQIASAQYVIIIPVQTVATPVFAPPAGIYSQPIQVSISTQTSGATIRYTLDNSEPSETAGIIYTGPINISQTTNIKAIAYKTGMNTSLISNASYVINIVIPEVAAPMFSHPSGTYQQPIDVAITTTTAEASIRFTTDGSIPSATNGTLYTAPIHIPNDSSLYIQAIAYKTGWNPSPVVSANYTVTGTVADVQFDPPAGIYTQATAVLMTTSTLGASIRYTTDGSQPTETSNLYSAPVIVPLNTTLTIRARAFRTGWTPSGITQGTYIVSGQVAIPEPVFSPAAGTYTTAQTVVISSPQPADATVRYTLDGSDPTAASPIYSTPIPLPLNSSATVKARAFKDNWLPSPVYSAGYLITGQVILPSVLFVPQGGTYQTAQSVVLNPAQTPASATLRYTLDGSEPSQNSPAYQNPINLPLNSTTTIKVKGFAPDWIPSLTASATYVITGQVAFQMPVFTPEPGFYNTPLSVTVSAPIPSDATVRYTLDGSEPTASSPVYSTPISLALNSNTTIKVKAFKTDWTPSPTQTGVYTITGQASIAAPVFSPAPGTYQTAQNISINTSTMPAGAQIRYTLDGSEPTAASTLYTAPISLALNTSNEIRARAFATNWTPSEVYVGYYTITGTVAIPEPVFTPPAGTYATETNVVLNTQTQPAGAVLRYTISSDPEGIEPDESSPAYTGPISLPLNSFNVIKVKAWKDGWTTSPAYTAVYTITGQVQLLPPYFSPAPGIYTEPISVNAAGGTNPTGGVVRYTTDGSEPNEASPVFDVPVGIGLNTIDLTITIRAFKDGYLPSAPRSGIYSVTGQVQLAENLFTPEPGTYASAQSVTLAAPVLPASAILRFTLDGSEPTAGSAAYSGPILLPLNSVTTLKVKGFAEGWIPSEVQTAVYTITGTVSAPVFSPPGGTYGSPVQVVLASTTEGAQIRYTTDGSEPSAGSELYSGPLTVPNFTQDLLITARAFKEGWAASPSASATYTVLTSPIQVRGFTYAGYIRLLWDIPGSLRDLQGFNVYRRNLDEAEFVRINAGLVNSQLDNNYYYDDYEIAIDNSYEYYVTAVYDGEESPASTSTVEYYQSQVLEISEVSCAYPNPAETGTTLKLVLNRNDNVQVAVSIYDFSGKKVRTLTVQTTDSNLIEVPWDLKNSGGIKVGRGTYFARVVANDNVNRSERVIKIAVK